MRVFKLSAEEYNSCELKAYQVEALESVINDILISYTNSELEQMVLSQVNEQTNASLRDLLLNGYYDFVMKQLTTVALQNFN